MPFIVYLIIPLALVPVMPISMAIMQNNARKKEKQLKQNEFIMRASKSFCVLIIIFTIIWALSIVLLNCIDNVTIWVNVILWICEAFLTICCIQSVRQKIIVKSKELSYTPIIGKTKRIAIKDIDKVVKCRYSGGLIKYKIYFDSKKFCSFAESAVGAMLLIDIFIKANIPVIDE